jgi:hypothetical protein
MHNAAMTSLVANLNPTIDLLCNACRPNFQRPPDYFSLFGFNSRLFTERFIGFITDRVKQQQTFW